MTVILAFLIWKNLNQREPAADAQEVSAENPGVD
jgi:hypothetical protein